FNISDIAHANQVSIETVKLNYTASGCSSCTFKITGPTSIETGQYEADWKAIGNAGTKEGGILYGSGSITSSGIKDYMTSQLSTDQLILGAASENEGSPGSAVSISINLTVTYTYQAYTLTAQNNFGTDHGGQIGVGVNTDAVSRTSPYTISAINGDSIHLAAYDHQHIDGYEWVFNNTEAPENQSEWTIKKGGTTKHLSSSQTTTHTADNDQGAVIADKQWRLFEVSRTYQTETGTGSPVEFGKVVEGNATTISAPASKVQNGDTLVFADWQGLTSGSNPLSVTPTDNTTYTAQYKGLQLSDDAPAYNSNQRHYIQSENGWTHMVYESMGHVWYERKAPGGSWQLIPQGGSANPKHLDNTSGKYPAIDFAKNFPGYPGPVLPAGCISTA
ncbi:MAG TPA: hypothetical protein VKA08_06570, partial [Balneolales bacterium]|nr:hypothetical protein [Balneolales bacterium]